MEARPNSTRDVTYKPEFRHDNTAVSTTTFMIVSAPAMPIVPSARAKGEMPGRMLSQGTTATISVMDSM